MKAKVFRGCIELIPESSLEASELKTLHEKGASVSFGFCCMPYDRDRFPFDHPDHITLMSIRPATSTQIQ